MRRLTIIIIGLLCLAATYYVVPTNMAAVAPYTSWGTAGTNIIDVVTPARAEDYYVNDFDGKDDVSFWCCGFPAFWGSAEEAQKQKLMAVHFKGITRGEKAYSGVRSFKLDLTLNGQPVTSNGQQYVYNYWRGPQMRVTLDKPVYLSGYLYPEKVPPDVEVALGWSVVGTNREGKLVQGNASIKEMKMVENGWIFFQVDLREALRNADYGPIAYLENWYLHMGGNAPFHGQRVAVYLDDVRVSSTKIMVKGAKNMVRPEVLSDDPYVVNYTSYFKERPLNPHNVVDNGSFELGLKNWQVSDNYTRTEWQLDDKTASHGQRSLKIFRPNGGTTTVNVISQLMPVEAGQAYTLSLYARGDESMTLDVAGHLFPLSNAWQRCVVPIQSIWTAPEATNLYSIGINQTGKGSVWIDAVQLEKGTLTDYCLPASTELGIYCERMGNIYHAGEPVSFTVNVFNAATNEIPAEISYSIVDFERKVVRQDKKRIALPAGQGYRHGVGTLLPPGYYKILAVLEGNALPKKTDELSVGVIVPIDNANVGNDSFFGVCGFGPGYPNFNLQRRFYAKESGVKYSSIYLTLYWAAAPENWRENNPQWERADRILSDFEQSGVIPVMGLWGVPSWAGVSNAVPNKLEEVTDQVVQGWHDYTHEVVRRYKDRVKYWELWLEFMHDPLEERAAMYIKFVKAGSEAIRSADPDAVIVGFGAFNWGIIPELEAHFKLGSLDCVDVVGLDCYTAPASPESVDFGGMLEKLKQVIRRYNHGKEKDIWVTEVGWRGLDTLYSELLYGEGKSYVSHVTELAQAEDIVRMNLISLAKGVKRFNTFYIGLDCITYAFPYNLMNYAASSPKTAFVAYNHMVNSLANARFEREIKIGGKILCYQFKKDDRSVIVIWNYDGEHRPMKIKFNYEAGRIQKIVDILSHYATKRTDIASALVARILRWMPISKVKATNMVGTPVELPKDDLLTTGSPLYFEASGRTAKKMIKAFDTARIEQMTMRLEWDKDNQLGSILRNETSGPIYAQVVLASPAGWQMAVSNQDCALQADERRTISFGFEKISFNPDKDLLKVMATSERGVLTAEWKPFPCMYVSNAPAMNGSFDEWRRGMPLKLGVGHRRGVENSHWQGDSDLSAVVYAQWDEQYLYLGVEVNDNIFAAPYTGHMTWANDALQIAFDPLNDAVGNDNLTSNDYEYEVSLTAAGHVEVWRTGVGIVNTVHAVVKKEPGKLFYELAFPWLALAPMDPKTRRDMGFNLTVMDNDGDEVKFPQFRGFHQYLQITDGICGGKRPGMFKDLILLEP